MLLNTMTVVGIGESNLANDNNLVKTSRNCSSWVPTWRISFSLALPTKVKFFEVTLVQVSFGRGDWLWTAAASMKTRSVAAALNVKQFIVRPHPVNRNRLLMGEPNRWQANYIDGQYWV